MKTVTAQNISITLLAIAGILAGITFILMIDSANDIRNRIIILEHIQTEHLETHSGSE